MNDTLARERARARRFDAELADVLAVPPGIPSAAAHSRGQRWLVAALVLLGVATTFAVAWVARERTAVAQQPLDLDPPEIAAIVHCSSTVDDLRRWPADVSAARVLFVAGAPVDIEPLRRLTRLRWLSLLQPLTAWSLADMQTIAGLRELEHLELKIAAAFPGERLAPLADLRALRSLTLFLDRPLRGDDVDALARFPALRSLSLYGGAVDAATLARLGTLAPLRSLELGDVEGANEDVLVALGALHQLQRIRFETMGDGAPAKPRNAGLTPRVARALRGLPSLRSLDLASTATSAEAIAELPESLTHVGFVRSPHAGPDVYAALTRFAKLQRLDLGSGDAMPFQGAAPAENLVASAQATLLKRSAVRELRWAGPLPPPVRVVLPVMPLDTLTLSRPPVLAVGADVARATADDVACAAGLPHLRRLVLDGCQLRLADLEPLRRAPKLAQLHLRWTLQLKADEVRALLPGVVVTTHGY
jgi:hypothetical protein